MPAGLDAWVSAHEPELRRHLIRMLGSQADADDVLQQVWLSATSSPPDDGAGSNVRAWLYRVATNQALDHLARDRRRSEVLARVDGDRLSGNVPPPDAGIGDPGDRVRSRIRAEIARLPPKQREAVWLRWVEELDYPEVARRIDASVESARANVYHGLQRLRETLSDLEPRTGAP